MSDLNRAFLLAEQATLKSLIAETEDSLGRASLESRLADVEAELFAPDAMGTPAEPEMIARMGMPASDPIELHQYLLGWANQLAARYGHPVYLGGSALSSADPRDFDVFVFLPDVEFKTRFCPGDEIERLGPYQTDGARRWGAEIAKISRFATLFHAERVLPKRGINIDFKVYPESRRDGRLPLRRIDNLEIDF